MGGASFLQVIRGINAKVCYYFKLLSRKRTPTVRDRLGGTINWPDFRPQNRYLKMVGWTHRSRINDSHCCDRYVIPSDPTDLRCYGVFLMTSRAQRCSAPQGLAKFSVAIDMICLPAVTEDRDFCRYYVESHLESHGVPLPIPFSASTAARHARHEHGAVRSPAASAFIVTSAARHDRHEHGVPRSPAPRTFFSKHRSTPCPP